MQEDNKVFKSQELKEHLANNLMFRTMKSTTKEKSFKNYYRNNSKEYPTKRNNLISKQLFSSRNDHSKSGNQTEVYKTQKVNNIKIKNLNINSFQNGNYMRKKQQPFLKSPHQFDN